MDEPILIKKNSITNKAIQKQKRILIIAVFCVITIFISGSYALLTNYDQTDDVIVFKTGNLNMTVNNQNGLINLNGKLPQSDVDALANNEPVTLTLTNTGTISIGYFEVKLTKEDGKESTLEEKNIRYAVSADGGATYSTIANLHESNSVVYYDNNLEVGTSKTIYLKLWIDENVGSDALDKTYYGSISVDLYQKAKEGELLIDTFREVLTTRTSTTIVDEEDGITYISGAKDDNDPETTDDVDYNYVWYSGKMWRITSVNSDGTMKLITDNAITSISYGSDVNFYIDKENTSYMYQWLNEDFLDTLYNYENIIVTDYKWNATATVSATTKLEETKMVPAAVGLLNSYEHYKSYEKLGTSSTAYELGYLNIGYYWWLLNPYDSSYVWYVYFDGSADCDDFNDSHVTRPSINLKSTIVLSGGTGTKSDPYRIKGDKDDAVANTTLLNTRSSGEYVIFDNELYRIVGIENNTTKLNKMDYIRDESDEVIKNSFSSGTSYLLYGGTGTTSTTDWAGYLNNTWKTEISDEYENMLVEGTYYLGTVSQGTNYKNSICSAASNTETIKSCVKTTSTWTGFIGLPRYGEMFAAQQRSDSSNLIAMWEITPHSTSTVWYISTYGSTNGYTPTLTLAVRPSINLKSNVVIKGGSGTEVDPYEISL